MRNACTERSICCNARLTRTRSACLLRRTVAAFAFMPAFVPGATALGFMPFATYAPRTRVACSGFRQHRDAHAWDLPFHNAHAFAAAAARVFCNILCI